MRIAELIAQGYCEDVEVNMWEARAGTMVGALSSHQPLPIRNHLRARPWAEGFRCYVTFLPFSLPLYHQHTYTSENNIWNYTIWKQFILTVVFKWVLLLKAWSSLFCSCLTTDKKNISCNKSSLVCSMFWEWYLPKGQMSHLQSRGVMQLQCHHRVRNIWESGHSPHPSEHRWQSAHCGGLPFPSCWPDEFPSRPFSSLALYSPFPTEDAKGQHLLALRADWKKTQVVGKSS